MKVYVIVYGNYVNGTIDTNVSLHSTLEKAKKELELSYKEVLKKISIKDTSWNELYNNGYSIGGDTEYSGFVRYKADIIEKEI